MKIPEEPQRPPFASKVVEEWFDAHPLLHVAPWADVLAFIRADSPPEVRAWADAHEEWKLAHEEWRKKLPVDYDMFRAHGKVRFYGGDWIDIFAFPGTVIEGTVGDQRCTVLLYDAIKAAHERMEEPEFVAFVATVYEHIRMREAAHNALVAHLLTGQGRT
jgi:hypothetical protein